MNTLHSINHEQGLYVINAGGGYCCLGFTNAQRKAEAVAAWLGIDPPDPAQQGTPEGYAAYLEVMSQGSKHEAATRDRCPADLHAQLIGLEGWRVEVTDQDDNTYRFIVGRSTGWMPCHLQIARRNSSGGPAVDSRPFKKVTRLYKAN